MVTFGADWVLRLWDLGGPRPKQTTACPFTDVDKPTTSAYTDPISYLHFAPGGDLLVGSGFDKQQAWLWRLRGRVVEPLGSFRIGPSEYLFWAGFSPQGELLLTGRKSEDGTRQPWLARYRLGQGQKQPKRLATHLLGKPGQGLGDTLEVMPSFSADGRRLALATRTGIFLWDWHPRRKQLASLEMDPNRPGRYRATIGGIALAPDGAEVTTAGLENISDTPEFTQLVGLHFWGLQGGQLKSRATWQEEYKGDEPHGVAFALGGKALLVSWGQRCVLLDRASQAKQWSWSPPGGMGMAALAPDGRHVARRTPMEPSTSSASRRPASPE
jgi:WD40 repeat protein